MPASVNNVKATRSEAAEQPSSGSSSGASEVATGAGVNSVAGISRPKTQEELAADVLYEMRIEEEYAKREGGA